MSEPTLGPNPLTEPALALSLSFEDGKALVTLRDRALTEGLIVRTLDLELSEVEFPLDLERGAEEFQRRSTRLRGMVLDLKLDWLAALLGAQLKARGAPFGALSFAAQGDQLFLQVQLQREGPGVPMLSRVLVAPLPGATRAVGFALAERMVYGPAEVPPYVFPAFLEEAIRGVLEGLSEPVASTFQRIGAAGYSMDPVHALLWALMPAAGWKLPDHSEVRLTATQLIEGGVLRVVAGEVPEELLPSGDPDTDALQRELAAEDQGLFEELSGVGRAAEQVDTSAEARAAAVERLLGSEDPVSEAWLREVALTDPQLIAQALPVVQARLKREPKHGASLLFKAGSDWAQGKEEAARRGLEAAARALRAQKQRRAAGLALRVASGLAGADRARLLEESIALAPDDPVALVGLVEALPAVGRASGAIRAARRLSNISRDPKARVRAHVAAARLLRDAQDDLRGARRELDRAARILPDEPELLEEQARTLAFEGKREEAAERYEALIARAEAEGAPLAPLIMHGAELWAEEDPERALQGYRRAHEAAPDQLDPLLAYVSLAQSSGREAEALWAVQAAAPLLDAAEPAQRRAMRLAAARMYAKDPDRREAAITEYEAAVEDPATPPELLEELASCYAAREEAGPRASALAGIAARLAQAGATDAAVARWSEAADGLPAQDPLLVQMLAAVDRAQAAAFGHRGLSDLRVALAEQSADPRQLAAAVDRRLVLDDPPEVRAQLYTKLGLSLERAGRDPDAARAYEQAVGEDPRAAEAVSSLVRLYRGLGDHLRLAAALGYAAPLEDSVNERTQLVHERAELLSQAGQAEEAYAVIQTALEERPDFERGRLLAARAAERLGRDQDVVAQLERCLQIEGLQPETERVALTELSLALERLGDGPDRLIEVLEQARGLAPEGSKERAELEARLARQLEALGKRPELAALNRARAAASGASPVDRGAWLLEAAQLAEEAEDYTQAEADTEAALALLADKQGSARLREQAFSRLEGLLKRRDDPEALAALVGRRATVAKDGAGREALLLQQASLLEEAGQPQQALEVLQRGTQALPGSLVIAARVATLAGSLAQPGLAADAYAASARLAKAQGERAQAVRYHSQASAAYGEAGAVPQARSHDRAILDLVGPEDWSDEAEQAALRLEADAREHEDHLLLSDVLRRRAEVAAPEAAAALWLDKAEVDRDALDQPEAAIQALHRARKQGSTDRALVARIDRGYADLLHQVGRYADEARVLSERAERLEPGPERARLLLRASKLHVERLEDPARALQSVQASLRADPDNADARALRLSLLRDGGRPETLAEALTEEAPRAEDPARAASLWMEAATVIAPKPALDAQVQPRSPALRRALSLVRRAMGAQPQWADPARAAVAYTRVLARPEEELVALQELLGREGVSGAEGLSASLRRAELLDSTGRFVNAQAELSALLSKIDGLSVEEEAETWPLLGESTQAFLRHEARPGLLSGALSQCVRLAEQNEDWPEAVRFLEWCVELDEDPAAVAALRVRAGKLLDGPLKDPERAEESFLAALAAAPEQAEAKACLRTLYVRAGRFEPLAETLGTEVLSEVWAEREGDTEVRKLACVSALWSRLPEGEVRCEAKLAAAELSEALPAEAKIPAEQLLEEICREGTGAQVDRALSRLRPLYMNAERFGPYCEVLRRQAERVEGEVEQAAAVAELGEALEDRLGDTKGAEAAYQRARGLDAGCERANLRLTALFAAQDRFAEIQQEIGSEALLGVVHELLGAGSKAETRAFAAVQVLVGAQPESERAATWLDVAEAALSRAGTRGPAWELAMLRRGAGCSGGAQLQVIDKLCERLREKGAQSELVDALRKRAELTEDKAESAPIRFELAERLLSLADSLPSRVEPEGEAEAILVALVAEDPEAEAPRARLAALYEAQQRWQDLGKTAGREALVRLRAQADEADELDRAAAILEANAELSEGAERAELLVDRVAYVPEDDVDQALALYRTAREAEADNARAKAGLRQLLESEGRYQELAGDLGLDTLRDTVSRLASQEGEVFGLLPATLALADVLEGEAEHDAERRGLLVDAAALQNTEGDDEAAEWALRSVLEEELGHSRAREAITALFVEQDRLQDLAELDPSMVEARATRAEETEGEAALAVAAWRVLAERDHEGRAQALWLKAARLDDAREAWEPAEEAYRKALSLAEQPAEREPAMEGLTQLLWRQERFAELPELLGPEGFLTELSSRREDTPDEVVRAVELAQDELPKPVLARGWELSAELELHEVDVEEDQARREDALVAARDIWDAEGDAEGQGRSRVALVRLTAQEEVRPAWVEQLADAYAHARGKAERASLGEELVLSRLSIEDEEGARALCEELIDAPGLPQDGLHQVAERFVEQLSDPEDHERREKALEISTARADLEPAQRAAWLVALADTREALGRDPERVVKDLEAALQAEPEADKQLSLHRRLYALYDELGEWEGAERHATVIAEADRAPEQWVTVSELRAWMDDREGARAALSEALKVAPTHVGAHESMIRLADQEGDADTAIQQLESWAEVDAEAPAAERAERLLRAAELSIEVAEEERAGALAERAVRQMPVDDPERFDIAERAEALLEPVGLEEVRVAVLQPVVGSAAPGERAELRLCLASLLSELGRPEEAATVIDGGLHQQMAPDDPVLERLLKDAEEAGPEAAGRRLLRAAERLQSGAAARRLRMEGARFAEAGGAREDARTALSHLVSEVGGGEASVKAREALVRLTDADTPAHLAALVESAEHRGSSAARAEGLIEAASVAEDRLKDYERAEELLRRALELTPSAEASREALLGFLERRERWVELQQELLGFTPSEGPERAVWCRRRAALARDHLNDPVGAASLLAEAFFADRDPVRGAEAVDALARAGRAADAERVIAELEQLCAPPDPVWRRVQLVQVNLLEAASRVNEAADRLDRLVEAFPEAPLFAVRRVQLCLRHDLQHRLLDALEAPMPGLPAKTRLSYRLVAAKRSRDDVQACLSILRDALAEYVTHQDEPGADAIGALPEPRLGEAPLPSAGLLELSDLAAELGETELSVAACAALVGSFGPGPERWRAQLEEARAEARAGGIDEAEETLAAAIEALEASEAPGLADRVALRTARAELNWVSGRQEVAAAELSEVEQLAEEAGPAGAALREAALTQRVQWLRRMGEDAQALEAASTLRRLAPAALSQAEWAAIVEAAGPSETLAELRREQAQAAKSPQERARMLKAAARVRTLLGAPEQALELMRAGYEADPHDTALAEWVGRGLYEAGRVTELEAHLAHRLEVEALDVDTRTRLSLERAQLLVWRLARPAEGLALLQSLEQAEPSAERLELELEAAMQAGALDAARAVAARQVAVSGSESQRAEALARQAILDAWRGATAEAGEALAEALSIEPGRRDWAERLAGLMAASGDLSGEAGLWLRHAGAVSGSDAVGSLERGAALRLEADDRRGALAAYGAAARMAPEQLSLRWALIDLNRSMGDVDKASRHAEEALKIAEAHGLKSAAIAAAVDSQELASMSGDTAAELAAWILLCERQERPELLSLLVERTQAGLPAAPVIAQLEAMARRLGAGPERARVRAARAEILETVLIDRAGAEAARAEIEAEDGGLPAAPAPRPVLDEEELREARRALEVGSEVEGLAELLHRYAQTLDHPSARARVLVEAAARLRRAEGEAEAALGLLREACAEYSLSVPAWQARLQLELSLSRLEDAQATVEVLDRLGGGALSPTAFMRQAARCCQGLGDPEGAAQWLARAKAQDPSDPRVVAELAALAESIEDPRVGAAWLEQRLDALDPVVEPKAWVEAQLSLARLAEVAGDDRRLGQVLDQLLDRRPGDAEVWAWQLKRLRAAGSNVFLLDALSRAADAGVPGAALEALELCTPLDRPERRRGLLSLLSVDDSSEVRAAIQRAYLASEDGAGLLAMSAGEAELDALSVEARAWVSAALLEQGRGAEAWRLVGRAEDPEALLKLAATPAREAAWRAAAEPEEGALSADPARVRGLEAGLQRLGPLPELMSGLLALERPADAEPSAMELLRALLRAQPMSPQWLSQLATQDPAQRGARAVHALLLNGEDTASLPRLQGSLSEQLARLRTPEQESPLSRLLRGTSAALAAVLPAPEGARLPGAEDPRLREPLAWFASIEAGAEVFVDPDGPARAWIEPGAPPRIVLGEALVDDASLEELRFHLLRAAALLSEGYLLVTAVGREDRPGVLSLLQSQLVEARGEGLTGLAQQLDGALRERLSEAELAPLTALSESIEALDAGALGRWATALSGTADRLGLLSAGELGGALRGIGRDEPRVWVRRAVNAGRALSVARRWARLRKLLCWLTSVSGEQLLTATAEEASAARF